jgi:hypothetical protein
MIVIAAQPAGAASQTSDASGRATNRATAVSAPSGVVVRIIDAPSDAARYTYFAVQPGTTLVKTVSGYTLRDEHGISLGGLPLPVARDAKQRPVRAMYVINDGLLTLDVNHVTAAHPVSIIARGPDCRNISCGWSFTRAQTTALFGAIVAGGTTAGLAVCARFGPTLPGVVCAAAVAFVAYLLAQGVAQNNRCLYISISPPGRNELFRC